MQHTVATADSEIALKEYNWEVLWGRSVTGKYLEEGLTEKYFGEGLSLRSTLGKDCH